MHSETIPRFYIVMLHARFGSPRNSSEQCYIADKKPKITNSVSYKSSLSLYRDRTLTGAYSVGIGEHPVPCALRCSKPGRQNKGYFNCGALNRRQLPLKLHDTYWRTEILHCGGLHYFYGTVA
ncbi:hypothetical protein V1477_006785 [Vespula maculifrons]|uniref:Uncharacterized protein n=2 Tax=Vespula TaxID=7451 RepID=A0A834JVA3_VESVU|nr:hypothetical protein HZH66_008250 [Vespula vulgaris]